MTTIRFETCDRQRALGFLRRFITSRVVQDTPEDAGPLLDFVEADLIRIPDPEMHPSGAVFPGKSWTDDKREEVLAAFERVRAYVPAQPTKERQP